MKTIEYRVQYTGATNEDGGGFFSRVNASPEYEIVRVQARDLNSGFGKALKEALKPLGSGVRREIGSVEFWKVI